MKYYDEERNKIVCIKKEASSAYWDKQWNFENFLKKVNFLAKKNSFVVIFSKKYLKKGDKILEAGCGCGHYVKALSLNGFDSYGIDYARETVENINKFLPNLKIFCRDVRETRFDDKYFSAYWSLGVIEHFYDGYEEVVKEARRIIKPGGYVFITFPYINILRKIKIKSGLYPKFFQKNKIDDFYQFLLNKNEVIDFFEKEGFVLKKVKSLDAVKGAVEDLGLSEFFYSNSSFPLKVFRRIFNIFFSFFCGHVVLLIFIKKYDNKKNIEKI